MRCLPRGLCLVLLLLMAVLCMGCGSAESIGNVFSSGTQAGSSSRMAEGEMTISMLNVGQGDAILIQTGEQNVLVDTSDLDERDKIMAELEKLEIKKIDKLILSHPHADHIGSAEVIIKKFGVEDAYDNGMPSTSKIYAGYVKMIKNKGIKRHGLKAGDVVELGNGASFHVYYPTEKLVEEGRKKDYKHDPNNESLVGKLVFGNFSMLFTGDAEKAVEKELLASEYADELHSDILKAAHHGSKTSSGKDFIKAVSPEAVLISAGEPGVENGNTYGYPHYAALRAYRRAGIPADQLYWTYENGTISVTTDGKDYQIHAEHDKEWADEWMRKK